MQNLTVIVKNNEHINYDCYSYFLQELVQHVPPNVFGNFARISHDSRGCT